MSEACEVCGFAWDEVDGAELPPRLRAAADGFAGVLSGDPVVLAAHRDAETWSVLEYASHVRDVMFNLRDRIVHGLAEDNPRPFGMYNDTRAALGLWAAETPGELARGIDVAAGMLARTIEAMSAEQLARPIFYPWPRPATRTLAWVGAQALHEAEHHLTDARSLLLAGLR